MKCLKLDETKLVLSDEYQIRLRYKINNIDVIQDTLRVGKCNIFVDSYRDDMRIPDIDNLEDVLVFLFVYIGSVLKNNEMAGRKKQVPYDVNLVERVDFKQKLCQLYIYVDDAVFGIVVGQKFNNIIKLVGASFPIMSKLPYDIEIRLFPMSQFPSR